MAIKYPIYLNLQPSSLMNGKGTGKKNVDDAAVNEFDKMLKRLVTAAEVVVKDPKAKKESVVAKYGIDIDKMDPKPATGFTFSCTILEITTSAAPGSETKVGMNISGLLSTWKQGGKGTGELQLGFLTSKGSTSGRAADDQKLARIVGEVAASLAEDIFNKKLESSIKNELTKP